MHRVEVERRSRHTCLGRVHFVQPLLSRVDAMLQSQLRMKVVNDRWIVEVLHQAELPLIQLKREGSNGVVCHTVLLGDTKFRIELGSRPAQRRVSDRQLLGSRNQIRIGREGQFDGSQQRQVSILAG